ncbi:NirD/YgiW/YdeI family stress tolerance protein [Endozoicomonas sp.]|uniref:NirD/YgiW/YdeI family stress tolerance protein n=1 Tax=Endozoicomonas sp. TaxID=1892382 RepID=UPI00383A5BD5
MKKGRLLILILSGFIASACSQEQSSSNRESLMFEQPRYHKYSVEEILSTSEDEELVKISGELIRKIKGKIYLFRGETGEIKVVIEDAMLSDNGLTLKSPVIIKGEVDNPADKPPRVDVDDIHYVF